MTDPFSILITDAVDGGAGRRFAQLVHAGRLDHPSLLGGRRPVAPSAVPAPGAVATPIGPAPFLTPRALETEEVTAIVSGYSRMAKLAIAGGFDGIEVHAGEGYLPHQFLGSNSNLRIDKWGGSIPNRIRFLLETVEASAAVIGADRVGVRISPGNGANGIEERDSEVVYAFLMHRLSKLRLAYLQVLDCAPGFDVGALVRANYRGTCRTEESRTPSAGALLEAA